MLLFHVNALHLPSEKHGLRTLGTKVGSFGLAMRQREMLLVLPLAGADFVAKPALCLLVVIGHM